LQPLPVSQLPPLAKVLKISYFNQIQTQVYHSIVENEDNVFIGASEGSGKFTLTLFAMNDIVANGKKVILIEPT
jgi:pre-mRNA-splicing helicase BRR2